MILRTAAVIALVAACGDNGATPIPDAAPRTCALDCAPYRCDDARGRCHWLCQSAEQCGPSFACVDSACIGTECTIATATQQCGAYACVDGTCATNCAIASCTDGYYCRGDLNVCMPRCTRAGDTLCDGYQCDVSVGECESYCFAGELACAAGYRCDANELCIVDTSAPACAAGCGTYACLTNLGRCATHCADDVDCAASAACVAGSCR